VLGKEPAILIKQSKGNPSPLEKSRGFLLPEYIFKLTKKRDYGGTKWQNKEKRV
jgi:hypothetical protein